MKLLRKILSVFLSVWMVVGYSISTRAINSIQSQEDITSPIKVSVIIPVYNTAPWLRDCLDSIVRQESTDIEVICVNDGSTDNSLEIINEYTKKDNRIKVISQENKGGAAARNAGLKIAKGEYIHFVDSDDYLVGTNVYDVIYQKVKEANADILVFRKFDGRRTYGPSEDKVFEDGLSFLYDKASCPVPWNKVYKRKFLINNNLQFPEHITVSHDVPFNLTVFTKAKRVITLKDYFYMHRRNRPGSLQTSSQAQLRLKSYLKIADYLCEYWRKNSLVENHSLIVLKKISFIFNHVVRKHPTLSLLEKRNFAQDLLKIMGNDIGSDKTLKEWGCF